MTGIDFQSKGLLVAKKKRKVFDPIHNFIGFDDKIWQMIDTPVFQRLRHLKQLGFCDMVWPGARHARFEHSLGVGHLAEKFILKAFENSSIHETNMDKADQRYYTSSVLMAGLFHDLGHGPFSHGFEGVIHRLGNKIFPFTK
jgi:HD superfamily phosphohydrolase